MAIMRKYLNEVYRVDPPQGRRDYLRLDMNENPEGLPQDFFVRVMNKITSDILSSYPENGLFKTVLSQNLGVHEENLLITNGSDDAIKTIFEVFGKEGKKIISVYPTFEMYSVYSKIFNMQHITIEYDDEFNVNVHDIADAIDKDTALVSILNPNNPIGNVYSQEDVDIIIKKAKLYDAIVIIDEAYYYFYDKTFLDFIKKYDNVIITRTFSKLCSIAGLRIGYAISAVNNILFLNKVRPTYSVNSISLYFAEEILKDNGLISNLIEIEKKGRNYILNKLAETNIKHFSKNGNYVFIYCGEETKEIASALKEKKILVKTYSHHLLNQYIRISTGSEKVMEQFWNNFKMIRNINDMSSSDHEI